MNYDPRQLIYILDELLDRLKFTQYSAQPTLEDVGYYQNCLSQSIEEIDRLSSINEFNLAEEEEQITEAIEGVNNLSETASIAVEAAVEQAIAVEATKQQAESVLEHWTKKLAKALDWLKKAQKKLIQAEAQLEKAKRELEIAQRQLKLANAGLLTCRLNPWQEDCSAEKARQRQAKNNVLQAEGYLAIALEQVQEAKEEVELAQAEVKKCQQAVNYTKQALKESELALEIVESTQKSAELALEIVDSANKQVKVAEAKIREAQELTEEMLRHSIAAKSEREQAQHYYQQAEESLEASTRLTTLGIKEIEYSQQQLQEFNRPNYNTPIYSGVVRQQNNAIARKSLTLNYYLRYGSFNVGDTGQIASKLASGKDANSHINFEVTSDRRIKILDIIVSPDLRRQGIGRKLVQNLISQLPSDSELYFIDNQAPEFWAKLGFKSRELGGQQKEFYFRLSGLNNE